MPHHHGSSNVSKFILSFVDVNLLILFLCFFFFSEKVIKNLTSGKTSSPKGVTLVVKDG